MGAAPSFSGGGGAGPTSNTVAWAEAYLHTNWHLSPSSRLATNIGRKLGVVPFRGGELGHHLTHCRLDGGLPSYKVAS